METSVDSEEVTPEIATISKELNELKNTALDDLKVLETQIPESEKNKATSLANVLKDFKIDIKKLNLNNIRKGSNLSGPKKSQAVEVITNNTSLFSKGRSKLARKVKKLGVLEYNSYLKKVYSHILQQWKLPVELSADLEMKVRLLIAKDGTLLQYALDDVSGNKIFDQSIKSLLSKLKTLPPLPEIFDGKLTEIGLRFRPL